MRRIFFLWVSGMGMVGSLEGMIKKVEDPSAVSQQDLCQGVQIDLYANLSLVELREKLELYTTQYHRAVSVLEKGALAEDGRRLTKDESIRRIKLLQLLEDKIEYLEQRIEEKKPVRRWCCWKCT